MLHATKSGYIVATLDEEKPPPLGVPVYDEDRRRIGELMDVIGPVKSPLAVVKPVDRSVLERVEKGMVLYYQPPRPPRRRRARERAPARKRAEKRREQRRGEKRRRGRERPGGRRGGGGGRRERR